MSAYVVANIDAIISVAVGVLACWYSSRKPKARVESQSKGILLRICGVVAIAFALLRFASSPQTHWERTFTADGYASAEFPGVPTHRQTTDSAFGTSLSRSSLVLEVPHKDIALFLSYTAQVDDEQSQMSHQDRVELLNQMLSQQGLGIVDDAEIDLGNVSGSRIEAQGNGGSTRMWVKMACNAGNVYRVIAVSTGPHAEDPIVPRFMSSFRIENPN